jgi:uncharacterized sulfatase
MSDNRPNIVFFFTDQQRWDTCGCYGQELPVTPNLDKMAAEGSRFEYAFTCQPVCGPARACLQTGKYATEMGVYTNGINLPLDAKTIAHHFNENGYETAYIGKWHLASNGRKGIDYRESSVPQKCRGGWKGEWIASDVLEWTSHPYEGHMFNSDGSKREFKDQYRADAQTDWVIEYLQNRKTDNPFCLFLSYIEPHHQNDMNVSVGPDGSKEKFKDYKIPDDLKDLSGSWDIEYPDYLGCCNSLDKNLGRIRAELERQGIAEDTVVIFTSDHGSHFRTRNSEYKRSCHDGCVRIPMVACGPGFDGGQVIKELASLIDIPPTMLECAGIDVPEYMRGRPLQSAAVGNAVDWPEDVFIQISESHVGRAVRTKKWKYEVWAPYDCANGQPQDSELYVERFLYDLESDPHEQNNLVTDKDLEKVRLKLRQRLLEYIADVENSTPVILPWQNWD